MQSESRSMPVDAKHPPLVSVIIPTYNSERFLAEAIESVLSQTYPNYEVIVVDDGSTDTTAEIARGYPSIRFVQQEHAGIGAGRNRGVKVSAGEYLAFLDADDLWLPEKLSLQMAEFKADPGLGIVSGLVEQFVVPGLEGRFSVPAGPQEGFAPSAMVLRRAVLERLGGFDEDILVGETISWFLRLAELDIPMRMLPQVVTRRRIHGENSSIRHGATKNREMMRLLKASMDRKRARERESDVGG
ncbi:MAG TPA: glycosyltransferase family A protein [Anaerolineae bacterium]|nr:glycosyltransferase family A protein [Anaerolineae bacterium]